MIRRTLIATLALIACLSTPAKADILSAPDAASLVAADEMILLDIRTEAEWRETGLAKGAFPVSMHTAEFAKTLSTILAKRGNRPIGLICATGGRTEYVTRILAANGIADVHDVSEGMLGNPKGPGWLARGMPVVRPEAAADALEDFLADN